MNKLVRGRIEDGLWIDEQTIWQAERKHYSLLAMSAPGAGRLLIILVMYILLLA